MSYNLLHISKDVQNLKERKSQRLLLFFTIILALLSFTNSSFATPFVLLMVLVFAFYNRYLAIAAYVSSLIISPGFSSTEVLISLIEISLIGASLLKTSCKSTVSLFVITTIFFMSMILGMAIGANSEFVTIFLFAFRLYLIVFIAQIVIDTDEKLIINSMLYSGVIIAIFVGYNFLSGNVEGFVSAQGRLEYQEGIKELAVAAAIPVFISLNKFINTDNRASKNEIVFYVVIFVICFPVLLLTYARGVIIALASSILLLVIIQTRRLKFYHVAIYTIIALVVGYIIIRLEMNTSLWFEHIEGGNGRTGIYRTYINYMFGKGSKTIIWGLGSANMKDVLGWYPHSTIFAYYFHFGIFGALFVLYQIIYLLRRLIQRRKKLGFYLCLFVMNIIMFSAHGSYDTVLYCVITGICFGVVNKKQINESC